MTAASSLGARLPAGGLGDPEAILGVFLDWVDASGLAPYPHQEEALLDLLSGHHVVLATPTGSGKSLVALGLHWKGLCEGKRSFYTAPIKALVSEKFFALCEEFGAERVGMLTGDASINPQAPIVCCTAEVLSNMALRHGPALDVDYVVMDEFHYYDDPERGVAWQVPLLVLERCQFLLMSATLGNTAAIEAHLEQRSGRAVRSIWSAERPVPLEFEYRETTLAETLEDLAGSKRAPIYVVSFTQRECGERAQALTGARLLDRSERDAIAQAIAETRFDTVYGKDLLRFLRAGVGVHHAGLLPRYRLLVERMAQQGLLKVICGTDTLGVGVNVPIRTVLFTQLCKYDGEKMVALGVRDFLQIAGRAGRKGFDERGYVVCQAPEHVIENKRRERKAGAGRRPPRRRSAPPNLIPWNRESFERLRTRPPEPMRSRFEIGHGMLIQLMQRADREGVRANGYGALIELIGRSHESPASKARLRRRAAQLFRSLRGAGVVRTCVDAESGRRRARLATDLQFDFNLHQNLSLFLVEALSGLDPAGSDPVLEVLSLVEAILENPWPILYAQVSKARRALLARMKAEGVPYEERTARLEELSWPKPEAAYLQRAFADYRRLHPWLGEDWIRPKSIAREMFEGYRDFVDYVKEYGVARSEGTLLRYLSQVHNTLVQNIPEESKSEGLYDAIGYLRTLIQHTDSSLIEAWERLGSAAPASASSGVPERPFDLAQRPRALAARVRAELQALLRALAAGDWEAAAECVWHDAEAPWTPQRFAEAMEPYFAEYAEVDLSPRARQAQRTRIRAVGARQWEATQVICDPRGDDHWALHASIDLRGEREPLGPLIRLQRIGI